jgi:hypothetical protein
MNFESTDAPDLWAIISSPVCDVNEATTRASWVESKDKQSRTTLLVRRGFRENECATDCCAGNFQGVGQERRGGMRR